jgi:hypothetical protein
MLRHCIVPGGIFFQPMDEGLSEGTWKWKSHSTAMGSRNAKRRTAIAPTCMGVDSGFGPVASGKTEC